MRTEKELWELVLSRQDLFWSGLCGWVIHIKGESLINENEYLLLNNVLLNDLPKRKNPYHAYCWEICKIQPRIDWINERIKQLEEQWK
jgi:hypothetical protein